MEPGLQALVAEADRDAATAARRMRARVALASIAQARGGFAEAVTLFEAALAEEPFDPVDPHRQICGAGSRVCRRRPDARRSRSPGAVPRRPGRRRQRGARGPVRHPASYALTRHRRNLSRRSRRSAGARSREGHRGPVHACPPLLVDGAARAYRRPGLRCADERAQGDCAAPATEDSVHLARAHLLAAGITLSRDDADGSRAAISTTPSIILGSSASAEDAIEIKIRRSRLASLQGHPEDAVDLAREALRIIGGDDRLDQGLAHAALADGLAPDRRRRQAQTTSTPAPLSCSRPRDDGATR